MIESYSIYSFTAEKDKQLEELKFTSSPGLHTSCTPNLKPIDLSI